jgi:hypothetical protein
MIHSSADQIFSGGEYDPIVIHHDQFEHRMEFN